MKGKELVKVALKFGSLNGWALSLGMTKQGVKHHFDAGLANKEVAGKVMGIIGMVIDRARALVIKGA